MGEIIIIDKSKADELKAIGFSYVERENNDGIVYVFIQSPELTKYIGSKFDSSSFVINKNVCF